MFEELMARAEELGRHKDTQWAGDNSALYDLFADRIELEWLMGRITDKEFDELAITAFYDYDNFKCEY